MGNSRWSSEDYATYSSTIASTARGDLYSRRSASAPTKSNQELNPENIQFRESRDSDKNPCACPIMVGLDVTGSMGVIAERIAKKGLGVMVESILERQPVADPHILFMGIGDCVYDRAPLQCTQFEADNTICEQLTDIWLEGGGGGNNFESYDLAWAFGAYRTKTDQWEKRKEKGYIFTIGDEMYPIECRKSYYESILKSDCPAQLSPDGLLEAASERYHIFHLIIAQGNFAQRDVSRVENSWKPKLGSRALTVMDYDHVAEVIVSAIAVNEGRDPEEVIESWTDTNVQETVRTALYGRNVQ